MAKIMKTALADPTQVTRNVMDVANAAQGGAFAPFGTGAVTQDQLLGLNNLFPGIGQEFQQQQLQQQQAFQNIALPMLNGTFNTVAPGTQNPGNLPPGSPALTPATNNPMDMGQMMQMLQQMMVAMNALMQKLGGGQQQTA